MWAPKCCDAVECWPDCKSYHFKIRMLNMLKGGIYLYGPVTKFYCQTMIQESAWGELCDISFNRRSR